MKFADLQISETKNSPLPYNLIFWKYDSELSVTFSASRGIFGFTTTASPSIYLSQPTFFRDTVAEPWSLTSTTPTHLYGVGVNTGQYMYLKDIQVLMQFPCKGILSDYYWAPLCNVLPTSIVHRSSTIRPARWQIRCKVPPLKSVRVSTSGKLEFGSLKRGTTERS
jgi:hypothetical protein